MKATLSTHDVARICGVDPRTALRWVNSGVLPGHQTGGGRRRVLQSDLLRFMRERGMPVPDALDPGPGRVAIVDDDRTHLMILERILLAHDPTLEIRTAGDGWNAGVMLPLFRPHLLFLDLVMPGLDGFEVCRRVRAEPTLTHTGIVVVTSFMSEAYERRLGELGAHVCLSKPVRPEEVLEPLQHFVPAASASAP